MFRSDRQISQAMQVLLRPVRLGHLWTDDGPTVKACELFKKRGGPMSHGESLMLLVCFDFWNGDAKVPLSEILQTLDREHLQRVATLLIAVSNGAEAVDRWIQERT